MRSWRNTGIVSSAGSTSVKGPSRKWPHLNGKSVLPSEADIVRLLPHVRFVPIPLQRSKIERRPDIEEEERPIPPRMSHPATRRANSRRSRGPPAPRSLRLSRRSHSAALPPTTTPHFPLAHECPNRDAQSRSARHHHPDSAPAQSWIGRRLFRQCLKDTGRAFCWHPETPGRGWKLTRAS